MTMQEFDLVLFLLQLLIIIGLLAIVFYLLRLTRSIRLEKRIAKYSLEPLDEKEESFFDIVYRYLQQGEKKLSKRLYRLRIFDQYSKKYLKYVDGSKQEREDPMDFISLKLFVSLIAFLIVLFSDVLQYQSITFLQVCYSLLLGFFLPDAFLIAKRKLREKQIENDLLRAIIIMNNAFKSGRSTMQAIEIVSCELDGPIQEEFKKMYIDLTYGLSLEVVFKRFQERVHVDEVKYITTSLSILNQTGGNIVKVFSSIERSFFNRRKLREELKSLTASANAIFKILVGIPPLIFMAIFFMNPAYFAPLFQTGIGLVIFFLILALYISYILIIRRVMRMKEV